MNQSDIAERFTLAMQPRIEKFLAEVADLDVGGIPEPHLPHWGKLYEEATPRIGIIGRDTRGWGDMPKFLEAAKMDVRSVLFRGKGEFDSLEFTNWTNNFGKTFWDTSLKLLATMHGVPDWKSLKRREKIEPLQSFFWANVNSVERFEVSPQANGVEWDTWRNVKDSSERHLDSLRAILDIFAPQVIFLLNWDPGDQFLDFPLKWDEFGDHQAEASDPETGCLILATAHPTWLNQNSIYDEAIAGILQKASKVERATPNGAPVL